MKNTRVGFLHFSKVGFQIYNYECKTHLWTFHSHFLDIDGTVWSCGRNEFGQLGLGDKVDQKQPTRIENLPAITSIHAGYFSTFLIDQTGGVWNCGKGSFNDGIPHLIDNIPPIQQIAAGQTHTIFLDWQGNFWGKGENRYLQLGKPKGMFVNYSLLTLQVPSAQSMHVTSDGTFILDSNGRPWGFGDCSLELWEPAFSLPPITAISSSLFHSLLLDEDGQVWGLGDNRSMQFGKPEKYYTTPTQLEGLPKIKKVCAGEYSSMCLDEEGGVWGCGYNGEGQLGLGNNRDRISPVKINARIKFQEIHTGAYYTTLIDGDGTFWGCGSLYAGIDGVRYLPEKITSFPSLFPISRSLRTKSARN